MSHISTTHSPAIISIYTSLHTLMEYAEKLNFDISNYSGIGVDEIHAMHMNDQLHIVFENREINPETGTRQKWHIYYKINGPVKIPKSICDELCTEHEGFNKNDILIMVGGADINDSTKSVLRELYEKTGVVIVTPTLKRLQFNIFKNDIVPHHQVISISELTKVCNTYNISDMSQFPTISRFEPVSQAICMRPGQVCKITRKSQTALESVNYRLCVNA